MPRQNRVTPYGELITVPDRGMFWGNRGPLLDREGGLARYQAFKHAFAAGGEPPGAPEIDARMNASRLVRPGVRRTYQAPLAGLPSGTMVEIGGDAWLVTDGRLLAWTPGGYAERPVTVPHGPVTVITPRVTVAVLAAGYQPVLHPSAESAGH